MELLPFGTQDCAMCGLKPRVQGEEPKYRFCASDHVRLSQPKVTVSSSNLDALTVNYPVNFIHPEPISTAHLHRTCARCGYEWLTDTFKDGDDQPNLLPTSDQQAYAFVKTIASELRVSAEALLKAAEKLKNSGHGMAANEAYGAYRHAVAVADDLAPVRA